MLVLDFCDPWMWRVGIVAGNTGFLSGGACSLFMLDGRGQVQI